MARLSLKEAADKIGVSTRTMRRRIKSGAIHASLEDGKYYLDATEIDRLSTEDRVDAAKFTPKARTMARPTETIILDRKEYDSLIYKLATLETELKNTQKLLEAPAKVGWWRRLWKR